MYRFSLSLLYYFGFGLVVLVGLRDVGWRDVGTVMGLDVVGLDVGGFDVVGFGRGAGGGTQLGLVAVDAQGMDAHLTLSMTLA
jgi:hypothetical protein